MTRLSIEEFQQAQKMPLTVVLDNVRSMHNVGSVLRTADAFRVEEVLLCGITGTPPHPEIHKTALGAEDSVTWRHVASTVDAVSELKQRGYVVLSVEQAEGSTMLHHFEPASACRYAVVLGNEVKGVQQEVIDQSDGCLEIPQFGTKHSMNVSVTAGIVIYHFARLLL
jgi:tRNA G18 (ribose-2'-O)-methylase SpoU